METKSTVIQVLKLDRLAATLPASCKRLGGGSPQEKPH